MALDEKLVKIKAEITLSNKWTAFTLLFIVVIGAYRHEPLTKMANLETRHQEANIMSAKYREVYYMNAGLYLAQLIYSLIIVKTIDADNMKTLKRVRALCDFIAYLVIIYMAQRVWITDDPEWSDYIT